MSGVSNLKKQTFSSMIWKFLERFCAQIVTTVVSIILARILLPEDYSVVSIVTIFFAFCNIFISGGINSALIQKKDADEIDYSTVLITNILISFILYFVMFFSAPHIAILYDKEILTPVIRVMSLNFFVSGYKAVICAKVSSDLKFKKFFFATIGGTILSAGVGIGMAINGFGAWALVAQQMIGNVIGAILLTFTTKIKLKAVFSFERFKDLLRFGGKLFLANIITTVYNELKPLVVGIKYSSIDLAFYKKGEGYPSLLNTLGSNTLAAVLFPAMSKLQDDKVALLNVMRRFLRVASFVVFPLLLGFFAVSDNFITIVLTDKWLPISPYLKIFCIVYMFNLIQIGNIQAIQAIGRSDITLKTEIIKKVIYFIIVLLFIFFTDSPVLLAASEILCYIVATIVNTYPNKKLIGFKYRYLLADILPNMITSVIMCVCVSLINLLSINVYLLFVLQVIVGAVIFIVLNLIIKNDSLFYMLEMLKSLLKKGK